MKRIIISIGIIAVIIALGCSAIAYIAVHNSKLYGKIDEVIASYEQNKGVVQSISELEYFYRKYSRRLGCITNDESLAEISVSISRLAPMYESKCDEFTAECTQIKEYAKKSSIPKFPAGTEYYNPQNILIFLNNFAKSYCKKPFYML